MKNIFKQILPLLAIMFLLTSCSDDDNTTVAPSVICTWELTGYYDYTAETFTPVEECYHESKTFVNDGTGTDHVTDCDNLQGNYPFLWEKAEANNTYNFIVDGDILLPEIITFENNNKMSITFGDDSAKVYERMLAE